MTTIVYAFIEKKPASILLGQGKGNLLVSYYHLKTWREKRLLELFDYIKEEKLKLSEPTIFILDSGAYSAWVKGKPLSVYDYIDFIKKYHSYFTHIVCLDVIGSPLYSEVNHLIMLEELEDYNLTIIPVFHQDEPFSVLDYMICEGYKYIGISPNNGPKKEEWLHRVFSRYNFEQLGIKTHGFGYQGRKLNCFPLTTADAVSWRMAAFRGRIIDPFNFSMGYSENASKYQGHVDNTPGGSSLFTVDLCKELNITIDELRSSQDIRDIFNIESLDRLGKIEKKTLSFHIELFDGGDNFNKKEVLEVFRKCKENGYKGFPETIPRLIKKNKVAKIEIDNLF